jgi:hypothetical protein
VHRNRPRVGNAVHAPMDQDLFREFDAIITSKFLMPFYEAVDDFFKNIFYLKIFKNIFFNFKIFFLILAYQNNLQTPKTINLKQKIKIKNQSLKEHL